MVYIITGASHTGKTALAQRMLEKYKYPYLSMDHLKMGLIRSGNTSLTPYDDAELTVYLWPIVCGIIKTAVENRQHLIVEGCYVPPNWESYFEDDYLLNVKCLCIVMTEDYIRSHASDIKNYANIIESRIDDCIDIQALINDNLSYLAYKGKHTEILLIDKEYNIKI